MSLTQMYRELDRDIVLFDFRIHSRERYEEELFVPTPSIQEEILAEFEALVNRVKELEAPDPVYVIVKSHMQDYLDGMRGGVEGMFKNPANRLLHCSWGFSSYIRTDSRPEDERMRLFRLRAARLKEMWEIVRPLMASLEQKELNHWADGCSGVIQDLKYVQEDTGFGFSEGAAAEAASILGEVIGWFEAWQKDVRENLISGEVEKTDEIPDDVKTVKLPEEEYRRILHDELGVELDELLDWGVNELEKTREEALAIAAKIDVPDPAPTNMGEVNDMLWKYAGPCDTPEEMFRRADVYLKRTRALAHEFVWLPEDEQCVCVTVPSELRISYPWGGYEDCDGRHRPLRGQMFLNQYNYKEITDGWIKMNAMHETYPGHHVQYVRAITDHIPHTMKLGAKYIPLLEGTAHRTERAFEFIYGEDPFFPLFVAYRRHHTAVRIKADLMLRYFGNTIEEVTQLYMKELGFAHDIARGQVEAQIYMTAGYFTCYYYGMKKLCDWEKEYGYSKKDYTEELFSVGNISLENFKRYLDLSAEDKKRFKSEFASLLMDTEEVFA